MASTVTLSTQTLSRPPRRLQRAPQGSSAASTPNLNALYNASGHPASRDVSRLVPPPLARKGSLAALTSGSLATIPDATESYGTTTLSETPSKMGPLTPARSTGDGLAVGDAVDVPGNMHGTVRFIGTVAGRKGTFAGVELHPDYASRGKNSGDVDGVSYFNTSSPGAGIFLPLLKAVKRDLPTPTLSYPSTPTAGLGLKMGNQNSTNHTPPTPSLPKFSQSVGPRAASPQSKRPRTSLPRPDSPVRRLQMTPGPRPSIATPAPKGPARFGSPTTNKFSQSVRGTMGGDPSKRSLRLDNKASVGPRSASALGQSSNLTDDETTPVGLGRTKTNGSINSVSSFGAKLRPASRANNDDEVDRLRSQVKEKDRQLSEQAATLTEMEGSLTELQSLIEQSDLSSGRPSELDDKDSAQLRSMLREKNDKIAMLTAEFDAHRADFRSTIDALEMASTETERVYEKRIDSLMQELQEIQDRTSDVDSVAVQLKQLEEFVQELEEGLEDSRRGEAEARGEVEFLRGEVERTRSELRREREKGSPNGVAPGGDKAHIVKELEQKEDEIRGLKAIIHSLSRDSVPTDSPDRTPTQRPGSWKPIRRESTGERAAREKLEREVSELRAAMDSKSRREEDLERELERLRRGSVSTHRASQMTTGNGNRSSLRDSRGTVVLAREYEPPSPEKRKTHTRVPTLDTMPESDAYSSVTESSTLWCEICETGGHDILTCTNMFGPGDAATPLASVEQQPFLAQPAKTGRDVVREGIRNMSGPRTGSSDAMAPPPLSPVKSRAVLATPAPPPEVKIMPNPMESGPVAGKESGVVDAEKWCAVCERDGHDSVDCPFEDAF